MVTTRMFLSKTARKIRFLLEMLSSYSFRYLRWNHVDISINELARMAKRDIRNVADDVKYLEQIGLVEKTGRQSLSSDMTASHWK